MVQTCIATHILYIIVYADKGGVGVTTAALPIIRTSWVIEVHAEDLFLIIYNDGCVLRKERKKSLRVGEAVWRAGLRRRDTGVFALCDPSPNTTCA
jgi:hypothetical protein